MKDLIKTNSNISNELNFSDVYRYCTDHVHHTSMKNVFCEYLSNEFHFSEVYRSVNYIGSRAK